jgi:hypothetical protein
MMDVMILFICILVFVRSFINQVASKILANLLLLFLFIATFVHQKRFGHKVYAGMALVFFILWTMMFIYYLTTLFKKLNCRSPGFLLFYQTAPVISQVIKTRAPPSPLNECL